VYLRRLGQWERRRSCPRFPLPPAQTLPPPPTFQGDPKIQVAVAGPEMQESAGTRHPVAEQVEVEVLVLTLPPVHSLVGATAGSLTAKIGPAHGDA
jgi:hypothetical protein